MKSEPLKTEPASGERACAQFRQTFAQNRVDKIVRPLKLDRDGGGEGILMAAHARTFGYSQLSAMVGKCIFDVSDLTLPQAGSGLQAMPGWSKRSKNQVRRRTGNVAWTMRCRGYREPFRTADHGLKRSRTSVLANVRCSVSMTMSTTCSDLGGS